CKVWASGSPALRFMSTPIRRTCAGFCASVAKGDAVNTLARSAMNARRLMLMAPSQLVENATWSRSISAGHVSLVRKEHADHEKHDGLSRDKPRILDEVRCQSG